MNKIKTRLSVFICNMVVIALCLLSILAYFVMPFWKIDASYHLSEEQIESMLADSFEEQPEAVRSTSEGLDSEEPSSEGPDIAAALKEAVGPEGITVPLALQFQSKDVVGAISGDAKITVENVIKDNVNVILEKLSTPINTIAKNMMRSITNVMLEESVGLLVESLAGENEDLANVLESAGLSDTYIKDKAKEVTDSLFKEGATVQKVAENTVAIVEDTIAALKESDPEKYENLELPEEDKENITNSIEEVLSVLSDENGEIDTENFLFDKLFEILQSNKENNENNESSPVKPTKSSLIIASAEGNAEEEATQESLEQMLYKELMSAIPAETVDMIAKVLKIVGYVLLFSFVPWLYLIVKILVKLPKLNNAIKLKAPILFGWLPFLILYVLPTVAFKIVQSQIANSEAGSKLAGLSITFSTAAWVSFAAAVVLFGLSFYYGILRKRLKKIQKGEIQEFAPVASAPVAEVPAPVVLDSTPTESESETSVKSEETPKAEEKSVEE